MNRRGLGALLVVGALAACGGGSGAGSTATSSVAPSSPSASSSPSTLTSGPTGTTATRPSAGTTRPTATPSRTATTATRPPTTVPPTLPASLVGHVVTRVPTTRHVVALTFDAGANGDGVAKILTTLRAKGVPGSFFLTGKFVTAYPDPSRQMAAYGRLGNHSVSHPRLPTSGDAAVRAQVTGAEATIRATTGESTRPFFRFPYGAYDTRTLRIVNGLGYVAVGWTVDSLGWLGTSRGATVDDLVARVVGARTPGAIVLMHVGSNPDDHTIYDADALGRVIDGLRAHGYSFVSVDALLG